MIKAFTMIEMIFVLFIISICLTITQYEIPNISLTKKKYECFKSNLLLKQIECILNNDRYTMNVDCESIDGLHFESIENGEDIIINEKGNVNCAQSIEIFENNRSYLIKVWLGCGRTFLEEK